MAFGEQSLALVDEGAPASCRRCGTRRGVVSCSSRLYVADEMAGVPIYTATSDSAGSLGGIVAQVESGDLSGSLHRALDRISWCSADPLCIESPPSGVDNLTYAACHACVLLPDTSCEEFNTLLDRALLTGTPNEQGVGFYAQPR
jgi:hypothetical protein